VRANIERTKGPHGFNGIASYALYWVLSVADYFWATADEDALATHAAEVEGKLAVALGFWGKAFRLHFWGSDDRVGACFESADLPENQRQVRLFAGTGYECACACPSPSPSPASSHLRAFVSTFFPSTPSQYRSCSHPGPTAPQYKMLGLQAVNEWVGCVAACTNCSAQMRQQAASLAAQASVLGEQFRNTTVDASASATTTGRARTVSNSDAAASGDSSLPAAASPAPSSSWLDALELHSAAAVVAANLTTAAEEAQLHDRFFKDPSSLWMQLQQPEHIQRATWCRSMVPVM
jgi:hypothetical protein